MKLVLQQSTQLQLRSFRHLGRHLRIPHPFLAVEVVQHLDRRTHVGWQLEHVHPLPDPHGGVGMSERVGHPALGPSFDCKRSLQPDETTVCSSPKLAALDRQLNEVYRAALKNDAANRERVISNQKWWLTCVTDKACIAVAYVSQIASLSK